MPTYEYLCNDCGAEFERVTRIAFRNNQECDCGSTELTRRVSRIAVWGDDIPGGQLEYHGICNPDGTPKRYYTKSSIRAAEEAGGWVRGEDAVGVRTRDQKERLKERIAKSIEGVVEKSVSEYKLTHSTVAADP